MAAINEMNPAPKVFVSASAVGYYPDQACYDEYTAVKERASCPTFCESWEREASRLVPGIRLAVARFGVVLAPDEGVFAKMAFLFRKGIAVRIASGAQIFAWIDIGDLVRALTLSFRRICWPGAINLTAPGTADQCGVRPSCRPPLRRPSTRGGSRLGARLLYGEASGMLVSGPCAIPRNCWMPDSFSMRRRSPRLCRNSAKRPRSERPCRAPSGGEEANGASLLRTPVCRICCRKLFLLLQQILYENLSAVWTVPALLCAHGSGCFVVFFNLQICIGHKDVNLFFDLVNQLFHKLLRLIVRHSEIHGGNRNSTF